MTAVLKKTLFLQQRGWEILLCLITFFSHKENRLSVMLKHLSVQACFGVVTAAGT